MVSLRINCSDKFKDFETTVRLIYVLDAIMRILSSHSHGHSTRATGRKERQIPTLTATSFHGELDRKITIKGNSNLSVCSCIVGMKFSGARFSETHSEENYAFS